MRPFAAVQIAESTTEESRKTNHRVGTVTEIVLLQVLESVIEIT
jgi:hypothetical protein